MGVVVTFGVLSGRGRGRSVLSCLSCLVLPLNSPQQLFPIRLRFPLFLVFSLSSSFSSLSSPSLSGFHLEQNNKGHGCKLPIHFTKNTLFSALQLKPWLNGLASRRKFAKPELAHGLAKGGQTDSQVGSQVHASSLAIDLVSTCGRI